MDNKDVFTYSITPEEYMMFRKAVGWAEFPLEQAEEGLKNSYICVIRREDKPIALGRIVTDHGYVVYIADVIVLPEYQGQGYMRRMLEYAYSIARDHRVPVILDTDDKDKAARYEHLGMRLDRVRNCGERFHMYDLIRE